MSVGNSREAFLAVLEKFEAGKVRIGTVRDLFRDHLSNIAEARGEQLPEEAPDGGALAG